MPDLIDDKLAGFLADIIILVSVAAAAWWAFRKWVLPIIKRIPLARRFWEDSPKGNEE